MRTSTYGRTVGLDGLRELGELRELCERITSVESLVHRRIVYPRTPRRAVYRVVCTRVSDEETVVVMPVVQVQYGRYAEIGRSMTSGH